jgi:hypothetical protein
MPFEVYEFYLEHFQVCWVNNVGTSKQRLERDYVFLNVVHRITSAIF